MPSGATDVSKFHSIPPLSASWTIALSQSSRMNSWSSKVIKSVLDCRSLRWLRWIRRVRWRLAQKNVRRIRRLWRIRQLLGISKANYLCTNFADKYAEIDISTFLPGCLRFQATEYSPFFSATKSKTSECESSNSISSSVPRYFSLTVSYQHYLSSIDRDLLRCEVNTSALNTGWPWPFFFMK